MAAFPIGLARYVEGLGDLGGERRDKDGEGESYQPVILLFADEFEEGFHHRTSHAARRLKPGGLRLVPNRRSAWRAD